MPPSFLPFFLLLVAGLWWGATDDLWRLGGKPQGWGGPWRYDAVKAGVPSDAYLMTGFDKKTVHFRAEVSGSAPVTDIQVTIQVDFTGSAGHRGRYFYMEPWNDYASITVPVGGYAFHVFPEVSRLLHKRTKRRHNSTSPTVTVIQ